MKSNPHGFTSLELVVVLVVIAGLIVLTFLITTWPQTEIPASQILNIARLANVSGGKPNATSYEDKGFIVWSKGGDGSSYAATNNNAIDASSTNARTVIDSPAPEAKPYGDKGFIVMRKGAYPAIYGATNINVIGDISTNTAQAKNVSNGIPQKGFLIMRCGQDGEAPLNPTDVHFLNSSIPETALINQIHAQNLPYIVSSSDFVTSRHLTRLSVKDRERVIFTLSYIQYQNDSQAEQQWESLRKANVANPSNSDFQIGDRSITYDEFFTTVILQGPFVIWIHFEKDRGGPTMTALCIAAVKSLVLKEAK